MIVKPASYFTSEPAHCAGFDSWSVLGMLLWLGSWVMIFCRDARMGQWVSHSPCTQPVNRQHRRMNQRSLPPTRDLSPFWTLLPRGLTGGQRLEYLCRLSVFGRVALYRMSRASCVLRRRALLVCYDHGWWRAPVSRLYAGLWLVHLRPK